MERGETVGSREVDTRRGGDDERMGEIYDVPVRKPDAASRFMEESGD